MYPGFSQVDKYLKSITFFVTAFLLISKEIWIQTNIPRLIASR